MLYLTGMTRYVIGYFLSSFCFLPFLAAAAASRSIGAGFTKGINSWYCSGIQGFSASGTCKIKKHVNTTDQLSWLLSVGRLMMNHAQILIPNDKSVVK